MLKQVILELIQDDIIYLNLQVQLTILKQLFKLHNLNIFNCNTER